MALSYCLGLDNTSHHTEQYSNSLAWSSRHLGLKSTLPYPVFWPHKARIILLLEALHSARHLSLYAVPSVLNDFLICHVLLIIQGPAQWPPLTGSLPGVPNSELASPSSMQLRVVGKVSEPLLCCQPLRASLCICGLGIQGQRERRKPSFSCPGLCKGGWGQ